jgi:hypothetical protein
MARTLEWRKQGLGYFEEQNTQPQTIGYSLADSPVGLLGWIYEKLITWTDDYPFTDDEGLFGLLASPWPVLTTFLPSSYLDLNLLVFSSGTCGIMSNLLRICQKW